MNSNHASLDDIQFQSDDWGVATMGVNFLINEVDAQEDYTLHVQQREFATQDVLGGFSYTFHRDNQRPHFNALIDENENSDGTSTYYAEDINEDAIYNWYDEDGELIYSGSSLTVSNTIAKEYELEITAEVDGHKHYKTIESEDKRKITSISPNPSNGNTVIHYLIGAEDNAALQFTHSVYASNYNYVLNNQESELALTTVGWTPGLYVVNLVVNGTIIDTKNLLIN